MSCLKSVANIKLSNPLISEIVKKYHQLSKLGMVIVMCWLPGHVGIKGNEMADSAVKSSLQIPMSSNKIPHSDRNCYISYKTNLFQSEFDQLNLYWVKEIVTSTCHAKKM